MEADPLVAAGLNASTLIFKELDAKLKAATDNTTTDNTNNSDSIKILKKDIKKLKKAALQVNKSFVAYIKKAHEREDRLTIEHHILKQATRRDGIDRDANRARVYEKLRTRIDATLRQHSLHPSQSSTNVTPNSIVNNTVDVALGQVARIEASIASLSPTGVLNVHGSAMLDALRTRPPLPLDVALLDPLPLATATATTTLPP